MKFVVVAVAAGVAGKDGGMSAVGMWTARRATGMGLCRGVTQLRNIAVQMEIVAAAAAAADVKRVAGLMCIAGGWRSAAGGSKGAGRGLPAQTAAERPEQVDKIGGGIQAGRAWIEEAFLLGTAAAVGVGGGIAGAGRGAERTTAETSARERAGYGDVGMQAAGVGAVAGNMSIAAAAAAAKGRVLTACGLAGHVPVEFVGRGTAGYTSAALHHGRPVCRGYPIALRNCAKERGEKFGQSHSLELCGFPRKRQKKIQRKGTRAVIAWQKRTLEKPR